MPHTYFLTPTLCSVENFKKGHDHASEFYTTTWENHGQKMVIVVCHECGCGLVDGKDRDVAGE